jgi:hypothetical protein
MSFKNMIILLKHKLEEIKKFSSFCFLLYVRTFKALEQFHSAKNFLCLGEILFSLSPPETHKKICIRNLESFFRSLGGMFSRFAAYQLDSDPSYGHKNRNLKAPESDFAVR